MAIDPLTGLQRAHREFSSRLSVVSERHWAAQSACEDWTVGDLVDHVIGGNAFTIEVLRGEPADRAMESAISIATGAAGRRKDAYESTAAEMLALIAEPGMLEGRYAHVAGEVSGALLVKRRTEDFALHAWDLARSIGAAETLDPELVELLWESMSPRAAELAAGEMFGGGSKGDISTDAPLQAKLLDLTGRR